jgi:hypothetical protein
MGLLRGTFGGTSLASQASVIARTVRARRLFPSTPRRQSIASLAINVEQATQHPTSIAAGLPSLLFKNGEIGAWFDPSDFSTMWQDANQTIPVTGLGQPVGFIFDKSGSGNHATQGVAASRPTVEARKNILLGTESLATQDMFIPASASHTLSFLGTGTVTLSGASTDGPLVGVSDTDRVSLTFTPTVGTLTLTVTGLVTDAQLELGADATIYQRVTTDSDYEDIGLARYLRFDGVDDFVFTRSIAANKATSAFVGAFFRFTNISGGLTRQLLWQTGFDQFMAFFNFMGSANIVGASSFGSTGGSSASATVVAPTKDIFVSTRNTDVSFVRLRKNGIDVAQSLASVGAQTSVVLFPLYLGSWPGGAFRFQGNIYQFAFADSLYGNETVEIVERYFFEKNADP